MGTDIHLYVERKENGKWVSCDKWTKLEYSEEEDVLSVDYEAQFYTDRNYNLFAILANVRNGYGFAGIKTGEGFNIISKPKGLPEDVCQEVKAISEELDTNGHSHSFFTVQELMDFDWTQTTKLQWVVDGVNFEEFERWRKHNGESPRHYCGEISGNSIRYISNKEMRDLISSCSNEREIEEATKNCYTLVKWEQPYYKCAKTFLSETMPKLWRFGNPKDVRIVFWFDN